MWIKIEVTHRKIQVNSLKRRAWADESNYTHQLALSGIEQREDLVGTLQGIPKGWRHHEADGIRAEGVA